MAGASIGINIIHRMHKVNWEGRVGSSKLENLEVEHVGRGTKSGDGRELTRDVLPHSHFLQ